MDELPDTALYLYCVVPATDPIPALSSPALDGGPVCAVRYQELAGLAHVCPPEPYQGSEEEVHRWIVAHNAVVQEAWERAGSVLPVSFDVIVRGDGNRGAEASLVGWLAEHYEELRAHLQALEGRAEVGVQILWDIETLATSMVIGAEAAGAPARGHAYFARQQLRRQLREQLGARAEADSRRYFENLAALADEVQVNKPRPVKARQMVLNLSLLVTPAAISRVGEYLEGVSREPGVEVRFTGPWPPYSFAGTFGTIGDGEPSKVAARGKSTAGGA
jgi:hypothetical protein